MAPFPSQPAIRPQVIQASFLGSRPGFQTRHHQAGTLQLATRGPATQLPSALLNLRPRSVGQPLPETVQRKMEEVFKADFSDVRVHVGPEAPSIGALAFTHGSDLYFAQGQYNPASPHGQRLIAHELTHVLQQRSGRVRNPFGSGVAVVHDPGLEAEAERMGIRAAIGFGQHVNTAQPKAVSSPVGHSTHAGNLTSRQPTLMAHTTQSAVKPLARSIQRVVAPRVKTGPGVVQRMYNGGTITYESIEQEEVEEFASKSPRSRGSYNHDEPKEFEKETWENLLSGHLGLQKEQSGQVLILGDSTSLYDCFNWSLGFRSTVVAKPPVTSKGLDALYGLYGIKRVTTATEAKIAVFVNSNGMAIHVSVKRPVQYNDNTFEIWTSKLGEGKLITHPTNACIVMGYYPGTNAYWLFA